jgi:hypothetical protein
VLIAVWAIFASVIRPGELLQRLPGPLRPAGVAGLIALTMLPNLVRALGEISEAQAVRGRTVRRLHDLVPLAVPLLSLSLERGLQLAEALAARGYGGRAGGWWSGDDERPGQRRRRHGGRLIIGGAATSLLLLSLARLMGDPALGYSAYPSLVAPAVSAWLVVASLMLLGPLVAVEGGWW